LNERKLLGSSNGWPPIRYVRIQEDIAWAKAVVPDFDIAMTTSNSNKRERSMETAQPASKKAKVTNRGTWSRSFAEVVKDRKIIGVIDQSDEGGRIPRNQRGLVRRALASVALKVLDAYAIHSNTLISI